MLLSVLLGISAHQGEADPALLHRIKETLDNIFGFGPLTIVVVFGALIVAMPLAVIALYLIQQRPHSRAEESLPSGGEG